MSQKGNSSFWIWSMIIGVVLFFFWKGILTYILEFFIGILKLAKAVTLEILAFAFLLGLGYLLVKIFDTKKKQ